MTCCIGHVLGHGGDLGRHDAAGGLLLVAEKPADRARVLDAHEAQQALGLVVGQVADDVGRVVGVHLGEQVGRAALGQVVDDVGLVLVFELRDRVGGRLVVQVLEDRGALGGGELLEDVGDVGRVQLVQALVGDGQLDLREVAVEQVHVVPRDERLGQLGAARASLPRRPRAPSAGEMPRRIPRAPTSAPRSRSWLRDSESLRSLTRTTFMPCVSTICLLSRSRWRSTSSGCR